MSKTPLSPVQRVVNSVWKAVRMLEERPAPTSKAKLYRRRGFGDADIPTPTEPLTATDPKLIRFTDISTGSIWWNWSERSWVMVEKPYTSPTLKRHKANCHG